jgi:ABC-type branched-subunit amino acid transport system substrate-binding protein
VAAQDGKLNENDFKIKDFGFKDGKPWITVEGKDGASKPQNTTQIYAYAFVTDKGVFAVVSHGVEDRAEVANDTQWHTH